jgi:hypothetical protein
MTEEQLSSLHHVALHAEIYREKKRKFIAIKRDLRIAEDELFAAEKSMIDAAAICTRLKSES